MLIEQCEASVREEKLQGITSRRVWPLTIFGTAVVMGLLLGVAIGVYIAIDCMVFRGVWLW